MIVQQLWTVYVNNKRDDHSNNVSQGRHPVTTIAVNHEAMACDLQMTYGGGTKMKTATKIIVLEGKLSKELYSCDKALIGFSGNASQWASVIGWFTDPTQKMPRLKGIELLMLTSKKKIFHASDSLSHWVGLNDKYFSIGSGCSFALGALECGKSPKESVLIASKRDPYTGFGAKEYML